MVLAVMHLPLTSTPLVIDSRLESTAERIEIIEAFSDLPDADPMASGIPWRYA